MTAVQAEDRWLPTLLPGGPLDLPERGTTFIRLRRPAAGEPTVLLPHGIGVTADVNWFTSYSSLSERYGVVAIDHRGHGRGIRPRRPVRLADCADDALARFDSSAWIGGVDVPHAVVVTTRDAAVVP